MVEYVLFGFVVAIRPETISSGDPCPPPLCYTFAYGNLSRSLFFFPKHFHLLLSSVTVEPSVIHGIGTMLGWKETAEALGQYVDSTVQLPKEGAARLSTRTILRKGTRLCL